MRLRTRCAVRGTIPTLPMASVALLALFLFLVSAVFSADRGLRVRISREESLDHPPREGEGVYVKILPDASLLVDGEPVSQDRLLDHLGSVLALEPEATIVLYATRDTPYGAMIAVVDTISSASAEKGFRVRRVSIPTHADVQGYVRALGCDPFEPRRPSG